MNEQPAAHRRSAQQSIAFAGFRHFHILDLYAYAEDHSELEIVGAAEGHRETADQMAAKGVKLTHGSIDELFEDSSSYSIVAVGDYYQRRGSIAIRALELGKHVILDKPICTDLAELDSIEKLSTQKGLSVGCMLENRDAGQFIALKRLLAEGTIGTIRTIGFMGHHPLLFGKRAGWYFEEGKHGGTINDIAIHAVDLIPWLTGLKISKVIAARAWNVRIPQKPHFQTCAQLMLQLENQAGILGDVSYLSPDSQGYSVPQYWRFTVHGDEGAVEVGLKVPDIKLWKNGETTGTSIPADADRTNGVLDDFLREIEGNLREIDLSTDQVISSSRCVLKVQRSADTGEFPQDL